MAGVAAATAIAADTVMAMDMLAAELTAGRAVMPAVHVVMPVVHAVTAAELADTAVAHVADLAAGASVADSAAVVVTWVAVVVTWVAVAVTWVAVAATAVADTGKFLIFPQNPRSCGIPPEKARLLRQAGLFCWFKGGINVPWRRSA